MQYRKTIHTCYRSFMTQAVIVNLPPLFFIIFQDNYALSLTALGYLVLINFSVQLTVDALCIKLLDKIGYRTAAVTAHALAAAGLIAMGILPYIMMPYAGLVISTLIFSMGSGIIEVVASPIVDSIPNDDNSYSMSLSHSFYCIGHVTVIAVTTIILKIIGKQLWFLLPIAWSILPIYNMLRFTRVPLAPPVSETRRTPVRLLLRSGIFVSALAAMICIGASEQAMAQWASLFVEKGLRLPKTAGDLLGPCVFASLMVAGRIFFSKYGARRLVNILIVCSTVCTVSYVTASLAPHPALSLAGCALCGLSVSALWPCTLTLASSAHPNGGTSMFAMLSLCGDAGCAFGPWLVGTVSDSASAVGSSGLQTGLLAAAMFPAITAACMIVIKRCDKKVRLDG